MLHVFKIIPLLTIFSQASELLKIIRSQFFNNLMSASASATTVGSSTTSSADGAGDAPSDTKVAPGTDGAGDALSDTKVAPGTDGASDAPSVTKVTPGTDGKSPSAAGGAEGTGAATGDESAPGAEGDGEVSKGLTKEDIKPPKCLTWWGACPSFCSQTVNVVIITCRRANEQIS